MESLVALVGFSFVSSVTPGPNNVLLWASGAEFGLRRTGRHVLGTALGIGLMALVVAAGVGAVIATVPEVALILKIGGSAYLVYLAWQIAGAGAFEQGSVTRPLGLLQATAFQAINPKAWIFVLGAVSTFRPPGAPVIGSLLVAGTMMLVVVPTAALWAGAGGALGGLLAAPRTRRIVSVVLAALVIGTVASIWV